MFATSDQQRFGSSESYAVYVLVLLWLAYILSFIDRQVLSLLIGPIREDFAISDTQFSLLHGLAFAIFYTLLGLPIGRWADRGNRRNIIVMGVALWSVMTCCCGFARHFGTLFLARVGVGVGEAALSPPAHSLLSDYFKPERLPLVFAFYTTGIIVGSGVAFIIGGSIYSYFDAMDAVVLPVVGLILPWQATFIAVGSPGILMAILMLTIREPKRNGLNDQRDANVESTIKPVSLAELFAFLYLHRKVYFSLILGVGLLSILGYATMTWYPEFLQRSYGLERVDAGKRFGSLFIIAGLSGTIILALIADYFTRKGHADISVKLIFIVACLEVVPAVLAPLMPDANSALLMASLLIALQYGPFGIAISALQTLTPNEMRAQVSAILLFTTNTLGLVIGPTMVALLTDYGFKGDSFLNYSLSLTSAIVAPLAAIFLWQAYKNYMPVFHACKESQNSVA